MVVTSNVPLYRQYPPSWFAGMSHYAVTFRTHGKHLHDPHVLITIYYTPWWKFRRTLRFQSVITDKRVVLKDLVVVSHIAVQARQVIEALQQWMEAKR